jgi:hypothetical protein
MTAIGAEYDVSLVEVIAYRGGHGLLADAEMHWALDLVRRIEADDLLLDPSDQIHGSVEAGRRAVRTLFH